MSKSEIIEEIKRLGPWHHDIKLTEELSTGKVFSESGSLSPDQNEGVSLISPRPFFEFRVNKLFGGSLKGKTFLDFACNGGAYCFLASEFGADKATGFDVREHWINQANFCKAHRTVAPTDNVHFMVSDLLDAPKRNLDPADWVYFSGIFYHLPDPVTGLKIAADLCNDVIVVNTACAPENDSPLGMTMLMESTTILMSGVHQLAWLPNSPEVVYHMLAWMGFEEAKLLFINTDEKTKRRRFEIVASRTKGRLSEINGEYLSPTG